MKHLALLCMMLLPVVGLSQTAKQQPDPNQGPITITLDQALKYAKVNARQFRSALMDAGIAKEDRVQARAALLPNVGFTTGMIYTQPNGTPTGRFIGANGIREYISQGVARESVGFSSIADYQRAKAAEALAKARAEVAVRGLVVTTIQAYYGTIVAQRLTSNAQQAFDEGKHFLDLSQKLERGGEVAHSDVIKAQMQANDLQRALQEAQLAEEKAKLTLAVLIFANFNQNFTVVDDLRFAPPLPPREETQELATKNNPELKAAIAAANAANHEVSSAIGGHLPSLTVNYFYGIDAANYATYTDGIRNLGYQVSATVDLPIWNWGATQSKVKQAQLRRTQARIELSAAQRQAIADLQTFYSEAQVSREQLDLLRQSAELAADSLRLTTLRYQGGEATALEVVDAQNALTSARNNYDNGEVRYRVAIANLQTLTGKL
jgi:outer membrane protein